MIESAKRLPVTTGYLAKPNKMKNMDINKRMNIMLKESIAFTSVNIIINVSGYFDHLLVGGIVPEAKLHRRP